MSPLTDTPAEHKLESLRVLIVEDSEDDALLMSDALRTGGYAPIVRRVATAGEMREALRGEQWDLILSDFRLPGFGALEAFALHREFGRDIPFLIVSGVIGEETAVAAMKAGVHDCLSKDNLGRLAPAVRRELGEAQSRRERAGAEAALRSAYDELATIHANVPALLLVVNEHLQVKSANDLTGRLSGMTATQMRGLQPGEAIGCANRLAHPLGCGFGEFCPPCQIRRIALDTLATGARHENVTAWIPVTVDGECQRRCLLVSSALMGSGSPKTALICALDVTELKQTQLALEQSHERLLSLNRDLDRRLEELQNALSEKDVLFKEVQHRVKNNLQVVTSLLSLQADQVGSDAARAVLAECRDRVRSMALIHEQLSFSGPMAQIDFAPYIDRLATHLLDSYLVDPARIQLHTDVAATLTLDQAVPCGLILQELLSNSLKHAFPGGLRGEIHVDFTSEGEVFRLDYSDTGIGLPPQFDPSQCQSLGMQLVTDLAAQLHAQLEWANSGGARFTLTFRSRV
jgi:two-component sensor histidine kinase/FixJ family two-component response regulator